MLRRLMLCLVFTHGCYVLAQGNLISNSSFELGKNGWTSFREALRAANNYENYIPLDYTPLEMGCEIDTQDARSGKNSFILSNAGMKYPRRVVLESHDFIVKPDQKYTVSFWAKSSMPGTTLICHAFSAQRMLCRGKDGNILPDINWNQCSHDEKTHSESHKITLSTEWKRYAYTFTPEKYYTAYVARFGLGHKRKKKGATQQGFPKVNIDCVQVEAGGLTDYAPKSNIEAAIDTSDYLYENTDTARGTVKAISYDKDTVIDLPITLFDTYFEKKLQEKDFRFDLKKGQVATRPFMFNNVPKGMFCVYTGLQPRVTPPGFHAEWDKQPECLSYQRLLYDDESYQSAAFFASVDTPNPKTETGFRLGTHDIIDSGMWWCGGASRFGSKREMERLLRLSGSNVLRSWFLRWGGLEPEKGKFNWAALDNRVEVMERDGIDLLGVVGSSLINRNYPSDHNVPEWVKKSDMSGDPNGTLFPKKQWSGKRVNFYRPQMTDWRNYVSAVATRYKGRIKFYEILNEADLCMPIDIYMKYMKAAAEEIRKADPNAVILGICSTADHSVTNKCRIIFL